LKAGVQPQSLVTWVASSALRFLAFSKPGWPSMTLNRALHKRLSTLPATTPLLADKVHSMPGTLLTSMTAPGISSTHENPYTGGQWLRAEGLVA